MSILAAAGSTVWLDPRLTGAWLAAICVFLTINMMLCGWIDRSAKPHRRQEWFFAGVTLIYTCLYGLLPLALVHQGQRGPVVAGAAMLGAVALSSTAEFPISRRIGSASLLAVLLIAALALWRPAAGESGAQALVAFIAAAAYLAYVLVAALQRAATEQRLVAALDVAREKEAEAAAANAAKTTFLATMSHEIRTPLNGVLGMIQVMQADTLSQAQRERLDVVRKSGEGLTAILNDVLDLSKIEAGRMEIDSVTFDLAELLVGCHHAFSVLAVEKGLRYTLSIAPEARGLYQGDPLRLRQVIGNLLSNAVKFTKAGAIDLSARLNGNALEIAVSDTGVGVAPDDLDRLFGKFSQLDASSTRRHGGTGLGLAICRELCGLMDGAIDVSSALDHGSTFTVFLPADRLSPAPATEPAAAVQSATAPAAPARVLAAEDNAVNQLVLKAILGQAGITPRLVANGAEAVEAWANGDWDVVLMDVHMPVMDGVAATQEIRRRESLEAGRARTPIIALTANAMSHQVTSLLTDGFDDHVAKPIDVAALFAALERAMSAEPGLEPA